MPTTIADALRELTRSVMGRPGVSGTAIGERRGRPCLLVYLSDAKASRSLPKSVEGYPVVAETTGPFERR
ncbi:MAG: hypothetical protein FJ207_03440 [Gemmatimonadetes bacterium]|nr:hypothetical protein [Gemmatimonadota bacterium]